MGGVKEAYLRVKTRNLRWAIFGFNDKKDEILTSDASADPSGSVDPSAEEMRAEWECMCSHLPADDVRYVVYDFLYRDLPSEQNQDKAIPVKSKLALISWAPDHAKPNVKMLIPSSRAQVKHVCDSCQYNVQVNDMADLDYDTFAGNLEIQLA